MAKITWLGEDQDDVAGPSFTTCFDLKFRKGEPVEVKDAAIVKKAKNNPFFEVTGGPGRPSEDKSDVQDAG